MGEEMQKTFKELGGLDCANFIFSFLAIIVTDTTLVTSGNLLLKVVVTGTFKHCSYHLDFEVFFLASVFENLK